MIPEGGCTATWTNRFVCLPISFEYLQNRAASCITPWLKQKSNHNIQLS